MSVGPPWWAEGYSWRQLELFSAFRRIWFAFIRLTEHLMATSVRGELQQRRFLATGVGISLILWTASSRAQQKPAQSVPARTPLVRVIDLDVGETQEITLCNGKKVSVRLVELSETRDS